MKTNFNNLPNKKPNTDARRAQNAMPKFTTGFTLIETLVAISILSLALAGILSLSSVSVQSSSVATNQNTAFFLASEGIEFIMNKSNSNIIDGKLFIRDIEGVCENDSKGCYVDVFAPGHSITSCSSPCPKLRFNDAEKRYDYEPGSSETIFTRKILVDRIVSSEYRLSVDVSWRQRNETKIVSLQTLLFSLGSVEKEGL